MSMMTVSKLSILPTISNLSVYDVYMFRFFYAQLPTIH